METNLLGLANEINILEKSFKQRNKLKQSIFFILLKYSVTSQCFSLILFSIFIYIILISIIAKLISIIAKLISKNCYLILKKTSRGAVAQSVNATGCGFDRYSHK